MVNSDTTIGIKRPLSEISNNITNIKTAIINRNIEVISIFAP